MKKVKIFVSSGHHDRDPGAISEPYRENEETIKDKKEVVKYLKQFTAHRNDIEIITDDDSDDLNTVYNKFNKLATKYDFLIDFHYNSAARDDVSGVEVFVANNAREASKELAGDVVNGISKMANIRNRGVKKESQSQHPRLLILHTKANSILIEMEFINNIKAMKNIHKFRERLHIMLATLVINAIDREKAKRNTA